MRLTNYLHKFYEGLMEAYLLVCLFLVAYSFWLFASSLIVKGT